MGETLQSIVIDAPVDEVWRAIGNFHDLGWAPNVVTSVDVVGDAAGSEVGARRVLNGAFSETLLTLDNERKVFTYSVDDGPGPLADGILNYVGKVEVAAADAGGTVVQWTSRWEGKDEAVHDFCHPIYTALLADMKKSLE